MDTISEILTSVFVYNTSKQSRFHDIGVDTEDLQVLEENVPTHVEEKVPTHVEENVPTHVEEKVPTHVDEKEPSDLPALPAKVPTHVDEKESVRMDGNYILVNQNLDRNIHLFQKLMEVNEDHHKTLYLLSDNKDLNWEIKKVLLDKKLAFENLKVVDMDYLATKRRGVKKWIVLVDYDSIDETFLTLKTQPFQFVIVVDRYTSELWNFTNHLSPNILCHVPKGKVANKMLYKKVVREFGDELKEEDLTQFAGNDVFICNGTIREF
jgi:hypothetical protein